MLDYYARRAPEYERIYAKPERRGDLAWLKARVRDITRGARVLDLACGTGFWTEAMTNARSIVGADYNDTVLRIARDKRIAGASFVRADNDALPFAPGTFDVMTAGCWWSHVPLQRLRAHVEGLHRVLGPGVRVLWFDNEYVAGSSTPIAYRDEHGNTWQRRPLQDGTEHDVLKNFPDDPALLQTVAGIARDVRATRLQYYWTLEYLTN
ncbi:2-methoxy-6-polyprenyl-1,4-benzoquinol methylase, mitochondrial [Ralstonia mannitolilytica]|uniref:class I SAM-dependent methyltransferase n=1 Tax=Ralstonia mannitolilytica TaxID=105219 RepID=UPI0028F5D61E|nr:class I SAM-dependent methyltransferase [Ralstonia mannitolilytica]CAJ0711929.1 2-methoxy-6-polyprenyl-1,4-benzoquinol methylase, mitochondrial [Ralstonia mannitolilytica]CAJ0855514.1 2-methoxy-6-polyprenyl-1,4-benzoquinol methylase, mitochondrial [Ralstonia mannitolilytica]